MIHLRMGRKPTAPMEIVARGQLVQVDVEYDIVTPEPDIGISGGAIIEAVRFQDEGCIMEDMTQDEINRAEELLNRMLEDVA